MSVPKKIILLLIAVFFSGMGTAVFAAEAGDSPAYDAELADRKSTRLNSSHQPQSRMPSSA